jgi:hypothetical protein
MGIPKRDEYERELVQIIGKKENKIYGQRGTHSDGIDVLLFFGSPQINCNYSIRCEVKTSIDPVRYFNKKLQEQYENYMEVKRKYNVITFYCFRTLSKKKSLELKNRKGEVLKKIEFHGGTPEDKWRIFKVDEVPLNNRGKPFLDFFHENGMTVEEFLRLFDNLIK